MVLEHICDAGSFSRTLCPEPCGMMHSYCSRCGLIQDNCVFETEMYLSDETDSDVEVDAVDFVDRETIDSYSDRFVDFENIPRDFYRDISSSDTSYSNEVDMYEG